MIKKKDLDQDDKKAWEEYIKNPSDIYDKDKNYSNKNQRKERFKYDLHGYTLEDANRNNGCLQVASGGHKGPLRKLFTKIDNVMTLKTLDNTPFEETTTPLEVKKGSLVLLHGRLPHYSCENTSNKSRHAYTLHVIDGNCKYSSNNWLQRSSMPLQGFI